MQPASPESMLSDPQVEVVWSMWDQAGREPRLRMIGRSMAPLIRDGDALVVAPRPPRVHAGDVLVYRRHGLLVAHRLVGVRRAGDGEPLLLLKGDRMRTCDPPVTLSQVLGRVTAVERSAGRADYLSRRWRLLNRLAAALSGLEARGYGAARELKHRWRRAIGEKGG